MQTEQEVDQYIAECDAKRKAEGVELAEKMSEFVAMSDKHISDSGTEIWLCFNEKDQLLRTAAALKRAGYRDIDAFDSPEDAREEQLMYSLVVKTKHYPTKNSERLLSVLNDPFVNINPANVFDMHDGTFLVKLDEHSSQSGWAVYQSMHKKATNGLGYIKPHKSCYTNTIKVNDCFVIGFTSEKGN